LLEKGLAKSRERAQALILAGKVLVDDQIVDKPGTKIDSAVRIRLKTGDIPYVSRGGVKLEHALHHFNVDITGWNCLDVGASTGGFTDCLLQHGARSVIAVDVGYGQLHWDMRNDPRVVVMERTNIRHLEPSTLPHAIDLATIDVSFISLKIVVPCVLRFLRPEGEIIALIKPQFEVGKGAVGKKGVVRSEQQRQKVIKELSLYFQDLNLRVCGVVPSPILGPKGNQEFFIHLRKED